MSIILSSVSRHVLLTAAVAAQEKRKRPRPFGFHLQYPFGGTTSADLDSASPQRGSASPGRATYLVPAIPGRPFLGADPVFAPSPCRPRASLSARQGTAPPDGLRTGHTGRYRYPWHRPLTQAMGPRRQGPHRRVQPHPLLLRDRKAYPGVGLLRRRESLAAMGMNGRHRMAKSPSMSRSKGWQPYRAKCSSDTVHCPARASMSDDPVLSGLGVDVEFR